VLLPLNNKSLSVISELTGGCICGSIRYKISAPSLRTDTRYYHFYKKALKTHFCAYLAAEKLTLMGEKISTFKYVHQNMATAQVRDL
jgi:hypothetical protein